MTENPHYNYSIILPVYNEEKCLTAILNRIDASLSALGKPFEVICIDDGSKDSSWAIINRFHQEKQHFKGLKFARNFGHQLAVYAGIKYASGDVVAILDADGQDPPEVLPQFFNKINEGYDVVYAVRKKRKENIIKRSCYALFYRFYKAIVPFDVPLDSGDFAVFTKDVAQFIQSLPEKKPFIRGLRSWYGGKQTGLEYERHGRLAGPSKYNYYKLLLLAINGSISFSRTPLRVLTLSGMFISICSLLFGLNLIIKKLTIDIPLLGWTSTTVLIVFFGGLNLLVLGVVGEYIGDIFDEVKNRPQFLVKSTLGF